MRARLIEESINFERSDNPLRNLGLGGMTYDTLYPGALIETTRFFGLTKSGTFTGIHGSSQIWPPKWFVVTKIRPSDNPLKRFISFIKFTNEGRARKIREEFLNLKDWRDIKLDWYGGETKKWLETSKKQFDYRMKIIEPGIPIKESFNREESNIYRKIGIGKKTWYKLKPGDILLPKKNMKIYKGTFYPPSIKVGRKIYEESAMVITRISYANVATRHGYADGIRMELFQAWDINSALEYIDRKVQDNYYGPEPEQDRFIAGSFKQFENRFEIYEG
jgi:hypothetical protein